MGNEQGKLQGVPTPAGIQSMDESLQKKFAKGIQYNMKIVIRGDRNTGKTTLFHRMEGKPFNDAYIPTNEIQVTSILWSYRVTNDTVKVEIWDVVDKARSQRKSSGRGKGFLKMFNSPDEEEEDEDGNGDRKALDANFLDVYKGAHGAVFVFDITKQWTWKYIERELPHIPLHIPVIILASFCDMSEHRLISRDDCLVLIETLNRPEGAADIRYAECSMKNGFGLMHLHKFLSIPFLQLQQETLLQQLKVNREQTLAALEELDGSTATEDQNYNLYLQKLQRMADEKKRVRQQQQLLIGDDSPTSPRRKDIVEPKGSTPSSASTHSQQATPPVEQTPPLSGSGSKTQTQPKRSGSITSKLSSKLSGFMGRGKEGMAKEEESPAVEEVPVARPKIVSKTQIEEFVPEGAVDDFLEDDEDQPDEGEEEDEEDSDEDSDVGNPMIAADEDLSSPEEVEEVKITPPKPRKPVKNISLDDSQSDEEAPAILTPIKAPFPNPSATTAPKPPTSAPKSKPTPKPLISALDIQLTESEEEEDAPAIMGDDDNQSDENRLAKIKPKQKQKLHDIFEPPPPKVDKKKNTSLMLQFDSSPKPPKAVKEVKDSPLDSPGREKRKKKSKKSKHSSKEKDPAVSGGGGDVEEERREKSAGNGTATAPTTAGGDPYGAIASLDAWLNSDSTNVDDFLQPTPVGEEVGVEDDEGGDSLPKKTKKHKHKKRSEAGEREGEGGVSHKKKHRSHHKSSRHRSLDQPDD